MDRYSISLIRANLSGPAGPASAQGQGDVIEGEREYYPCGCTIVVDRKTGATVRSFPCEKHKFLEAGQE